MSILKINHNSKLPLHAQVEELMRDLIISPKYMNGTLLPKEVELANLLGVSRSTIRQATNKLENEGLLKRKKGVGTTVAPKKILSTGLDHWYSFTQEMKERGIEVQNLFIKAEFVPADENLSRFFKINIGRDVLKLSKLKGVGKDPIVYFESYFHPRIGVKKEDDFDIPLYTMLEKKYKIIVVRSNENITARLAGKEGKMLKVSSNAPVLFRERFVYDPGGRPIECNLGYYRSDKFTYTIDITKNS
ncbi:MAG: GntR family transcriptional regulator [Chitinophagaceae bacterium]|nr:GntR family transcriptional regulator [Chitinophagaceae bacterium]